MICLWYVAVLDVWSIAGQIVYYSMNKKETESYIKSSHKDIKMEELTDEEFQKAKQNKWYLE
jgi:hypothetical protein